MTAKSQFREMAGGELFSRLVFREWKSAASNGSWRSLSFVRFLRSRFETIIFYSACLPSAAITGCVQDASYACKKRTPHSRHFRFDSPPVPVALYAAKSLPALGVRVSGRDAQEMDECGLPLPPPLAARPVYYSHHNSQHSR